ncbi:hypothetical protein BOX30_08915 [Leptospirillum ferriphilum]|jgi:hypothetical protein|uniref:Uncharacterized protein n=1 Tax=Leptospirillum ferriphilum TaxID=178606 RepID=A0A1V3SUD5_9BACT|nr:hypothetical protein BOX24_08365 [Leptospirillum ferriphilum]OOH77854.1 hypothetical protein BOX30_08915 [Leptospirillum ferriphilum]
MACFSRLCLRLIFVVFLCMHCEPMSALAGVLKTNPFPVVRIDKTIPPNESVAIFFVENRKKSFVAVRLDGVKVLVRSLEGETPVRIVLDHLPPGRHRVTFRLAHPDQYEFGGETVFRFRVSSKSRTIFSDLRPDPKQNIQGLAH